MMKTLLLMVLASICGQSISSDRQASISVIQQAVDQNVPEAEFTLAEMYRFGSGVPKNQEEAMRLYQQAAIHGHPGAKVALQELRQKSSPDPMINQKSGIGFKGDPFYLLLIMLALAILLTIGNFMFGERSSSCRNCE